MWTSKRVMLLVAGGAVFVTAFAVYAQVLGYINGLPPLPAEYRPKPPGSPVTPPPIANENDADRHIRLAFGEGCPELKRPIKLHVRSRRLALAAGEFTIEEDGRVKLTPFSLATFGKSTGPEGLPEINTIRCDVAFLTFDRPISNPSEIGGRKMVAAELDGWHDNSVESKQRGDINGVWLINNRRTTPTTDDMTLFTPGPVYFQDEKHQIWTREAVCLTDQQPRPNPTVVKATGMDVYLLAEEPPPAKGAKPPVKGAQGPPKGAQPPVKGAQPLAKGARPPGARPPAASPPAPAKSKDGMVSGVREIVLRSEVDMHLMVDSRSGFLGAGKPKATKKETPKGTVTAKTPADGSGEQSKVVINTHGPFQYDLLTDIAHFDIAQQTGAHPSNHVTVFRLHGADGAFDKLDCDHLTLKFQRKKAVAPAAKDAPAPAAKGDAAPAADSGGSVQLEIETAHATGSMVTVNSESEGLTAFGNDLTYDAANKKSILKGDEGMIAMKDGHELYARVLIIEGIGDEGQQTSIAQGPGRIELRDKRSNKRTQHASWRDTLTFNKDGEYDVLHLRGQAVFEDTEQAQLLSGDEIKVWLEPSDKKESGAKAQPAAGGENRMRPHHLDAVGNVAARSLELNVHDTDHLIVRFRDPTPLQAQLPDSVPAKLPEQSPEPAHVVAKQAEDPAAPAQPAPEQAPAEPATEAPKAVTKSPSPAKPRKMPIDLSAHLVEAFVVRLDAKNEMEKVWCEGAVRVHQDPAKPEEKGVDIRGQTLQLTNYPEGHVLLVTGDLAEVHMDKLSILGPEVNIDQKENTAWVNGIGAMRLPSNSNMSGEKLERPTEVTIHWNRNMFFNGKDAQFYGGIQAEQENARLACQTMQVFLDRFVSLKEGNKGGQPAKVEKMVCDKSVRVEDTKIEPDGRLLQYQRLESREMSVDNQEGLVIAPGPGIVRMVQLGDKDEGPSGSGTAPANTGPREQELKFTRVTYLGRMFANNQTRTAIFYDNVELVHVPGDNPDMEVDLDHLPPGGLFLRCEQLKVYSQKGADGKTTSKQMEAHRKAIVQAREFWGRADVIKFDEAKELVIFEAAEGNLATLYRILQPGKAPEEIKGKKIKYYRKTNAFAVEGGVKIEGSSVNPNPGPNR